MIILWLGVSIGYILIPITIFSTSKLLFKNIPEGKILMILSGVFFSIVTILITNHYLFFLVGHFRITLTVLFLLSGISFGNALFYQSKSILKNSLKGILIVTLTYFLLFWITIILIQNFVP
jgi:hypothetical protein